jgi:hypothetical protein
MVLAWNHICTPKQLVSRGGTISDKAVASMWQHYQRPNFADIFGRACPFFHSAN